MDSMQARIEMVIYLIGVLKDFLKIVLDFLPNRNSSEKLSADDSFDAKL